MIPNPINFVKAAARAAKAVVARHEVFVADSVVAERTRECERWGDDCFEKATRQCRECTCFVDVKAMFATEKCPRKKWRL